jgi:hypothetical protein
LPAVPPPTRQLPLVPPPAGETTGSTAASPAAPVPTGPVDWMPLPPEPGAAPPDPPRTAPGPLIGEHPEGLLDPTPAGRRARLRLPQAPGSPRGGRGTAAAALGAVALLLLELGLLVHEGGTTLWAKVPLWAAFATAAAVAGLAAPAGLRAAAPRRDRAWAVGAGGLSGLAVFWVLVVLPTADTDRGFVLTAALACLGGCLWLTAGRGEHAEAAEPVPAPDAEPAAEPEVLGGQVADEPAEEAAPA